MANDAAKDANLAQPVKLTLPDGSVRDYPSPVTGLEPVTR